MQHLSVAVTARRGLRTAMRLLRSGAAKCGPPAALVLSNLKKLCITAEEVEELKKGFVALSSLWSLLLVATGPLFFPEMFIKFCSVFFALLLVVNLSHFFKFSRTTYKIWKTVSQSLRQPSTAPFRHIHALIIPNYCEPLPLLRDTVSRFAAHPNARSNYVMVLAMEAAEGDEAVSKAEALSAEFKSRFLDLLVSVHPKGLAGEFAGKGANVAWAAKHAAAALCSTPTSKVILTIADADATIAPLYFSEIEREMVAPSTPKLVFNPEFRLFAPPMLFARNCQSVPAAVRATDAAWSIGVMQNLSSTRGLNIPCSTYSVTLPLALHVGGWDTDRDAIGEDMHMFLKCFYHTRGAARCTPIWAPVNLANVQDSEGYAASLGARYTQARRHFAGFSDSLYAIRHTFILEHQKTPANPDGPWASKFDRILCLLNTLEAHLVPATAWLSMLAMPALRYFSPAVASSSVLPSTSPVLIVPYIGCVVLYELLHRFLEITGMLGTVAPPKSYDCVTLWAILTRCRTRLFRNMLDYGTLPVCVFTYVAAPATSHCSVALRILVRAPPAEFKYIVATKMVAGLGLQAEEPCASTAEAVPEPLGAEAQCTSNSSQGLNAQCTSVPPPHASDEAICADILPLSTTTSARAPLWLSQRRGHIKHDSGIFALEESKVSSLQVVA